MEINTVFLGTDFKEKWNKYLQKSRKTNTPNNDKIQQKQTQTQYLFKKCEHENIICLMAGTNRI